jgi:hypothetical protein
MNGIRFPVWGWEGYSFLLATLPTDFGKNTFNRHRCFYEASCMLLNKEPVTGVLCRIVLCKNPLCDLAY